jgi:hypothetical protein
VFKVSDFEKVLKLRLKVLTLYTFALGMHIIFLMIRFWPEQFGLEDFAEWALAIPTIAISLFLIITAGILLGIVRKLHDNPQWKSALYDELFYKNRLRACAMTVIVILSWQVILLPISHYLSWTAGLGAMSTIFWGAITFFSSLIFLSRD